MLDGARRAANLYADFPHPPPFASNNVHVARKSNWGNKSSLAGFTLTCTVVGAGNVLMVDNKISCEDAERVLYRKAFLEIVEGVFHV
jgi:hypothetical protein